MRTSLSLLKKCRLPLIGLAVLASGSACISSINEGLNINDMNVTVLVPKTLATSAQGIGVVYVGLYSGVQAVIDSAFGMDLRLPLPIQAPGSGTSAGETYPYAGTTVGDYLTRDARFICLQAFDRAAPVDDGNGHWALQAPLLQFPFYPGSRLWAFADQATGPVSLGEYHPTCNRNLGRFDSFQVEVQMLSVAKSALYTSGYDIALTPTDVNFHNPAVGGGVANEKMYLNATDAGGYIPVDPAANPPQLEYLVDAAGYYWQLYRYKSVVTGTSGSLVITVLPILGDHPSAPTASGPNQPQRIYKIDGAQYPYGAQANDVINLPQRYVFHGDFMTSTAAAITLQSPADTTITLDMQVP